nr:hypothetical protein [Tanacetum cinerariifolium]
MDNGMRFMLAPRSAKAKHSSIRGKSNGQAKRRLRSTNRSFNWLNNGSNNWLSMRYLSFNLDNQRLDVFSASVISRRHRVLCHIGFTFHYFRMRRGSRNRGSLYAISLRVMIPFKSSFGLVMVLLERVPEPKDEASQIAVEESRLAEPEIGNLRLDKPVLDKPVLDKLEAGVDYD